MPVFTFKRKLHVVTMMSGLNMLSNNNIDNYIMTDQSNAPLLLIGNAGSGKSAIMAKSANDTIAKADRGELMSASGCGVFFHFVGATPGSTDLAFFLQWLSREINVSKMLNRSFELCLKTYGEKHMLMLRLNLNIGILNEDNRDLQKAYDYVVKWHETCLELFLCHAGYVGYTCRHLHQRIDKHKGSAIGNHLREQHDMEPEDITQSFRVLRKCQNKFDCLIFEMFFIKELKPTLNKQSDSIRAKPFVQNNSCYDYFILFHCIFLTLFNILYHILAFATCLLFFNLFQHIYANLENLENLLT
ncbi:uncharacterized protein [Montipora capricornis]|uniref:uncharacterized protein isoform X2 n=2 Tax=Montipora capricornis TaxID=246305 RepID=UPI0035F16FEF